MGEIPRTIEPRLPPYIYINILLLLRSSPSRQQSNVLCHWMVRRRKTGKHGKLRVKRKWWVLAQPPYSPQENGRQLPWVEPCNQGDKLPDAEENARSRHRQRLGGQARPRAHSRYIHVKQEWYERGPKDPPTIESRLSPPHIYICI